MGVEEPTSKPFGPAAAAFISAGLASLVFGLLTVLAYTSSAIADALNFMREVGALSGEAIVASAVFFAAWKGLALIWKEREMAEGGVLKFTFAMVALGVLLTFPPVYHLF